MKPQITQSELSQAVTDGKDFVVQYRDAYQISFLNGTNSWGLFKILRKNHGLPFTGKGRFFTVDKKTLEELFI